MTWWAAPTPSDSRKWTDQHGVEHLTFTSRIVTICGLDVDDVDRAPAGSVCAYCREVHEYAATHRCTSECKPPAAAVAAAAT